MPVPADRRLDAAAPRLRTAVHEREVDPFERPLAHELAQPLECLLRARRDEQARRVAIEPVDDARALRVTAAELPHERIDERVAAMTGAGMDDEAGGLVDHQQVLVLPDDARRRRGRNRLGSLGLLGELHLLASGEPVALHARDSVDDRTAGDRALGRSARAERRGEEPVEPLAGRVGRHAQLQRAATSSRRRGGFGARSAANSAARSIATPTTMNVSARLNAGQYLKSMKSVTWPRRIRSTRFERLPPINRPSAAGSTG